MRPILFTLFGYPVRSYGVFIAIAVLAAMWLTRRVAARRRAEYVPLIEDFMFTAFIAAILGARIWEVVFTWEYYQNHLWEIPAIWHGGISIQGAVTGGVLAALWFARTRKLSFGDFLDTLTPGLALGQAIGRLGSCLLNGDAYGKPTGSSFGLIYAPGSAAYETFGPVPLWPAEVFEGLWDLAIMAIALRLLRRERPAGTVFLTYAVLYSIGRFSLEFLRADSLTFMGLKSAQVTSVIFALVGTLLLIQRRKQAPQPPRA